MKNPCVAFREFVPYVYWHGGNAMSELDFYRRNQAELVKRHMGKILALRGGEVIGVYDGKVDALRDMKARNLEPGSFLIIKCTPGDAEYTRRYRSRVDFPAMAALS